ncbi:hypothetical protein FACS1894188_02010 [Clostridia bacterium]|nr:hypothetical protein FACS1894188_02010 [Clostridia bacterium]
MHLDTTDYLKKALLDTQERIRDYMGYAGEIQDENVSSCFREFAETEGLHASQLQDMITDFEHPQYGAYHG